MGVIPLTHSTVGAAQIVTQPTTTPLLEALKAEKSAQRDKEAILRNHAHYKESVAAAKREEAKKKAVAIAQKQSVEIGSSMSKKEKKAAAAAAAAQKGSPHDIQPPMRIQTSGMKQPVAGSGVGPTSPPDVVQVPPVPTRLPRERTHRHKGAASSAHASSEPTPALGADDSSSAPQAQSRRGRPVVAMGRHFTAAMSGVVRGGERRKRGEKRDGS